MTHSHPLPPTPPVVVVIAVVAGCLIFACIVIVIACCCRDLPKEDDKQVVSHPTPAPLPLTYPHCDCVIEFGCPPPPPEAPVPSLVETAVDMIGSLISVAGHLWRDFSAHQNANEDV